MNKRVALAGAVCTALAAQMTYLVEHCLPLPHLEGLFRLQQVGPVGSQLRMTKCGSSPRAVDTQGIPIGDQKEMVASACLPMAHALPLREDSASLG